jgi:hypothetical protein
MYNYRSERPEDRVSLTVTCRMNIPNVLYIYHAPLAGRSQFCSPVCRERSTVFCASKRSYRRRGFEKFYVSSPTAALCDIARQRRQLSYSLTTAIAAKCSPAMVSTLALPCLTHPEHIICTCTKWHQICHVRHDGKFRGSFGRSRFAPRP